MHAYNSIYVYTELTNKPLDLVVLVDILTGIFYVKNFCQYIISLFFKFLKFYICLVKFTKSVHLKLSILPQETQKI